MTTLVERLRSAREATHRKAMLLSADFATPHRNAVLAYDAANEIGLGIVIARPASPQGPAPACSPWGRRSSGRSTVRAQGSGSELSLGATLPETYLTHSMKATGGWSRKSAQYPRPSSRRPSRDTSGACQRTSRRPAARNAFSIVPTLRW